MRGLSLGLIRIGVKVGRFFAVVSLITFSFLVPCMHGLIRSSLVLCVVTATF